MLGPSYFRAEDRVPSSPVLVIPLLFNFFYSSINKYVLSFCIPYMGQTVPGIGDTQKDKTVIPKRYALVCWWDWDNGVLKPAPVGSRELTAKHSGTLHGSR